MKDKTILTADPAAVEAVTEVQRNEVLPKAGALGNASSFTDAAEQQLRLQATALELAANPILITDHAGRILWVNAAFTTLTGYSAEEAVGKTPRLLKSGQHDEAFYQNFWQTILAGQTWRGVFTNRRKDGGLFYDELTVTPIREAGGKVTHFIGVMHDVTARTQAETRLMGSEAQYRRLFEAAKDGILILNAETGMIEDVNLYLTELLGFTREQFLRKKVWELGFFKNLVASQEKFHELQRVGYVRYEDLPLEAADGRKVAVEFVSNVYEVNGAKVIQCNIRNITERKQAQADLRASEERYRALVDRAPTGIFINVDDQFAYVNDAFCRILGASSPEQLLGKPLFERFRPEFHDAIRKRIAHIRETGEGVPMMDQQYVRLDGSLVEVETMATATIFQDRPAIQVIVNEVTQRKQAEEALKLRAAELERFHRLSVGRELQMIELKKEVNELATLAGRTPPHALAFMEGKLGPQTQP